MRACGRNRRDRTPRRPPATRALAAASWREATAAIGMSASRRTCVGRESRQNLNLQQSCLSGQKFLVRMADEEVPTGGAGSDSASFATTAPDDLSSLPELNDDAVLHGIHLRFGTDQIYTHINHLLIAVNPYKLLPIYGEGMMLRRSRGPTRHSTCRFVRRRHLPV